MLKLLGRARASLAVTLPLSFALLPADPSMAAPATFVVPAGETALASVVLAEAGTERPVILFDPSDRQAFEHYARGRKGPFECLRTGATPETLSAVMEAAAGAPCRAVADLVAFALELRPQAPSAVVVRRDDYAWLLRAAAFAGATGGALLVADAPEPIAAALAAGPAPTVLYLSAPVAGWREQLAGPQFLRAFENPDDVTAELVRVRGIDPPKVIVVANPRDRFGFFSPPSLSLLAPLVAARHRAPLFLTNESDPRAVEATVVDWVDRHRLRPTHVVLVGDELALRSHRVADPVLEAGGPEAIGGGKEVRVELFSGIEKEQPQDWAVGRIVAEDAARGSATLARQIHDRPGRRRKPAIFLSNADEVFSLGETISRTTVSEFRNLGVPVRTYFGDQVKPDVILQALEGTDLLVWEGHARDLTLEEQGGVSVDSAPDLVVLQGCYTLDRSDPFILMERGTNAIVATSAAIYSASGSAFARAFFDALLYEGADLGTAVRDARNYLLAVVKLKKLRGHEDWTKTYRAALAFTLWGDPTARPPLRTKRPAARPAVWTEKGSQLELSIPRRHLPKASAGPYYAWPAPRAMLSGLLVLQDGDERRRVKELFYLVEPKAAAGAACATQKGWDVVSLYAPRTRTLSVLARPDWKELEQPTHSGTFAFTLAPEGGACPPVAAATAPAAPG